MRRQQEQSNAEALERDLAAGRAAEAQGAAYLAAQRKAREDEKRRVEDATCSSGTQARARKRQEWEAYQDAERVIGEWQEAHCRVADTRRLVVTTQNRGATSTSSVRRAGGVELQCPPAPKHIDKLRSIPVPEYEGDSGQCHEYDKRLEAGGNDAGAPK